MPSDKLEALFESYLKGSRIFLDREVLRHDFVPGELPHRENEILRLGSILAPALMGSKCSNVFIYGKTGTGKTAVARYVLSRLTNKSSDSKRQMVACYVNCRVAGTEYRVINQLCASLSVKIPFTGLAASEAFARFKDGLETAKVNFIACIDEVDMLVKDYGDQLLYELTRVNEELSSSKVTLVGVSNDLYFKDMLDARVLSSLSEEEMVFKPYTAEQLQDILVQRSRLAFKPGALTEGALNLCAALAASEHGDARRALDLLRVAGEVAERSGSRVVQETHVREAQKKIENDKVLDALNSLPLHSKILLCAVHHASTRGIVETTGDLYERYKRLCEREGVEPLTYRRISGLLSELDMLGVVSAQISNMGRYGRTKRVRLNLQPSALIAAFKDDPRVSSLLSAAR